jgi:DNA-binding LacI/PurR family transcriptional regulator
MVSIRNIAKEAGVSPSTVVRVLHHRQYVDPAKRERILAIAQRLHYRPLTRQSDSKARLTKVIGCIVTRLLSRMESTVVAALGEHLHQHGYALMVKENCVRPIRTMEALRFYLEQDVAGVVVHCGHGDTPIPADLLRQFIQRGIPVVTYDITPTDIPCDWVGFDEEVIAEKAVGYLATMGHRKIACVGAYSHGLSYGRPRALHQALQRHQFSTDYFVGSDKPDFDHALGTVLQSVPRPTAIICESIEMAAMTLRLVQRIGLHVPSHMSIIGIGSKHEADPYTPHLTYWALPEHELAVQVTQLLQQRINNDPVLGAAPVHIPIKPHFIERTSCAAPLTGHHDYTP